MPDKGSAPFRTIAIRNLNDNEMADPLISVILPDDVTIANMINADASVTGEEADPSWAEHVEALIYSFISSHSSGAQIQIVSLVCRTTRCEIVGTVFGEQGGEIWSTVLKDMQAQPWFSSYFANSMFGSGGASPGEYRFITILVRVGSEIGPAVPQ